MKDLTMREITEAVGGKIVHGDGELTVNDVSRDSREVTEGTLFFALVGESTDAHAFLEDVVKSGCKAMVISKEECLGKIKKKDTAVILVEDTLKALQMLAAWYIRTLDITIVGITGSVGKTTTKNMLNAICKKRFVTGCTQGNYNNHLGLPLTVLNFEDDTEVGIIEMGMDKFGEIDFLADLARPHIALITTIGSAHIEFFGTQENILKAKMEITNYLKPTDVLMVNGDSELLRREKVKGDYRLVITGSKGDCDYRISDIQDFGEEGVGFKLSNLWRTKEFRIPVPGLHNVNNAALAIAAAFDLGIGFDEAAEGLSEMEIMANRLAFKENKGVKIIDDTYNASPEAMRAAIDLLATSQGKRKIAILGDMYELGKEEASIHFEIGKYAQKRGIDLVIGVGHLGKHIGKGAGSNGVSWDDIIALKKAVPRLLVKGNVILVKASRGMALEEIVEELLK